MGKYKYVSNQGTPVAEHRLIAGAGPGQVVDHINGDTKDNRPENLRITTNTNNVRRRTKLNKNNSSGFRNVYATKVPGRWTVRLRVDRKMVTVGTFGTITQAAEAARLARNEHYGEEWAGVA